MPGGNLSKRRSMKSTAHASSMLNVSGCGSKISFNCLSAHHSATRQKLTGRSSGIETPCGGR